MSKRRVLVPVLTEHKAKWYEEDEGVPSHCRAIKLLDGGQIVYRAPPIHFELVGIDEANRRYAEALKRSVAELEGLQ